MTRSNDKRREWWLDSDSGRVMAFVHLRCRFMLGDFPVRAGLMGTHEKPLFYTRGEMVDDFEGHIKPYKNMGADA